ncbi:MAG: hypothetical protein WD844_00145 [Thermoleophilaceae bacterium]
MRPLLAAACASAALLAAAPAPAGAKPRPRDLWATVNVCDTEAQPNALGVRARMPGDARRRRAQMYVRFRVHHFSESEGIWHNVGGSGISRWFRLGSARVRHREVGYTFRFDPPADGGRFVLRGVVEYQWRERRRMGRRKKLRTVVVRRARANTKGGFESTAGADPPGFSSGLCEIR